MGREADPSIKAALLEKILFYLLENGILELSLRPLAKTLGTNARMLIYHFGSKEQMITEALELAQRRQLEALANSPEPKSDGAAELTFLWQWFSSDEFLPFGKLLFETEVQAISGNAHYGAFATQIIAGWVAFIKSRFEGCDLDTANLIVNTFSGFLLELLITKDKKRVTASFNTFSELLREGGKL